MVSVGEFDPHHCTATDDAGVIRVCDPRAWLLWLWAISHGKVYRTSPYGFEAWEMVRPEVYNHFAIKYAPMQMEYPE